MNTLMQMGPMMVMENGAGLAGMHHQPFPQPSQMMGQTPITSSMNRSQRNPSYPPSNNLYGPLRTSDMFPPQQTRSNRCGVCRGCQCKPCGQCTYCQDSPQFGGPGVKKQSCIERRCLRVLENRLQRDAPTFKARVGCNQCEDCRMPDCQICLVCLDKRFFENRYMTGAMCAKKRCNNATSIELPAQSPQAMHEFQQRQNPWLQAQKRTYDQVSTPQQMHFDMKRRLDMQPYHVMNHSQNNQMAPQPQPQQNGRVLAMNPAVNYGMPQMVRMAPPPPVSMPCQQPTMEPFPIASYDLTCSPPSSGEVFDLKPYSFIEELAPLNGDPFIPPSYAPEMKNAVVLQPL